MQPRVEGVGIEEGKDPTVPTRTNQTRVLPQRLLILLVLFLVLCFVFSVISIYMIRQSGIQSVLALERPKLKSCIGESNSLDHWIKAPTSLMHTMSDEELFWRATMVPRIKKYPFERVPKVAFMFLTKGPLPLAPLWERFFKGHEGRFSNYVHSLPSFEDKFPSDSFFYRRQIPSQNCLRPLKSVCLHFARFRYRVENWVPDSGTDT